MMQTMVTGWRKAAGAGRAPPDRGGRGRASNEAGPDVETTVEVVGVRSGIGLRNTRREGFVPAAPPWWRPSRAGNVRAWDCPVVTPLPYRRRPRPCRLVLHGGSPG